MRAAVYRGDGRVSLEEAPVPEIGPEEILVRVACCGVCGTDLKKIRYGLVEPPRIFGHETAGTIEAVGPAVEGWRPGDRVAVNHHVPCLRHDCRYCCRQEYSRCPTYLKTGATAGYAPSGGGFAEFVRVMDWCVRDGLVGLPDEMSFEEATFIEPLNTCLKGIRLAGIMQNDVVVVSGQGPIGLLFTQLARTQDARVIATDYLEHRLEASRRLGASSALRPDNPALIHAIRDAGGIDGADAAIVCVPGGSAVTQAFKLVRPGGRILLFAHTRMEDPITLDAGQVCFQEKRLLGAYSSDITLQDECVRLITSGQVDVKSLVSHRYPLSAIRDAIDAATDPSDGVLKVLVQP